MVPLSDLKPGEKAIISHIDPNCRPQIRQRFLDLGFVKDTTIWVEAVSPLRDPVAYNLHNTLISLRWEDAKMIMIKKN